MGYCLGGSLLASSSSSFISGGATGRLCMDRIRIYILRQPPYTFKEKLPPVRGCLSFGLRFSVYLYMYTHTLGKSSPPLDEYVGPALR